MGMHPNDQSGPRPGRGAVSDFDKLARIILLASGEREASWVHAGMEGVTYGHYRLTIDQAVDEVCDDKQIASLANLLLFTAWNDAHDWAHRQLYPAEMAYIECCYRVMLALQTNDVPNDMPKDGDEFLYVAFRVAAEEVRKELWARPLS